MRLGTVTFTCGWKALKLTTKHEPTMATEQGESIRWLDSYICSLVGCGVEVGTPGKVGWHRHVGLANCLLHCSLLRLPLPPEVVDACRVLVGLRRCREALERSGELRCCLESSSVDRYVILMRELWGRDRHR